MTVLHVTAGNVFGGIERMLVTLAHARRASLRQHFAAAFDGRLERELRAAGASVFRLPPLRASRPLSVFRARRAFARLLDDVAPDAVVFHGSWPHAMFARSAAGRRALIVFWQHQPIAARRWPDRLAVRTPPHFAVYNSGFTRTHPAFPDIPGAVIHCPVQTPPDIAPAARQSGRAELGASDDHVVVLMAARLERWKGHAVLLNAVRSVPDPRLRVWIAGGPLASSGTAYRQELCAMAGGPGLQGRVTLLGERDDVPRLMRLADIYCQPNLEPEPFGISIAEAMRAGLPCIVSDGGGAAELVDRECGVLTRPGDVRGVADALERLSADPALRETLGCRGADRAERLTDPAARLAELESALSDRLQS
jgi:glycosyltransferase involved in cell wall biosynthesis